MGNTLSTSVSTCGRGVRTGGALPHTLYPRPPPTSSLPKQNSSPPTRLHFPFRWPSLRLPPHPPPGPSTSPTLLRPRLDQKCGLAERIRVVELLRFLYCFGCDDTLCRVPSPPLNQPAWPGRGPETFTERPDNVHGVLEGGSMAQVGRTGIENRYLEKKRASSQCRHSSSKTVQIPVAVATWHIGNPKRQKC